LKNKEGMKGREIKGKGRTFGEIKVDTGIGIGAIL
jgi:hypothetical protein